MKRKNIVIIGGGSGTSTILSGLREFPCNLSVIVSSADDGGSSGKLRKALGVMPPGDIRQCLLALANTTPEIKEFLKYRLTEGELKGHVIGNLIIASLEKITGNQDKAIKELSNFLDVKGKIMFSSTKATTLSALYEDGTIKNSEHEIDEPENHKSGKIIKLSLNKSTANPEALKAIAHADAIILGPGDLYTSVLPNLLVTDISKTISKTKAKKILITNIMTKYGQTDNFKASDFLKVIKEYLPKTKIDFVLINSEKPTQEILNLYKKEQAKFVEPNIEEIKDKGTQVITAKLFSDKVSKKAKGDKLKRSFLRHDSDKIATIIMKCLH